MALSLEVLNTTYNEHKGPLHKNFERRDAAMRVLFDKGRVPAAGGAYFQRSFSGGSPASGVGIYNGDELLTMTRTKVVQKFLVQLHRIVVAINIPQIELDYNSGKLAVIQLIREYPELVMMGAKTDLNKYLLCGVSAGLVFTTAELRGFLTLNGQVSTGRGVGNTNGAFDFVAPASQTDVVQNVTKAASIYHYNQHADITGWSTNGMRTWRNTHRLCGSFDPNLKGPDVILTDPDTFANFEAERMTYLQTRMVEDKTEKTDTMSLDFMLGKVYCEHAIDLTQFTGDAADGVTYMVTSDYMELPTLVPIKTSNFQERVGDQDVVTAKMEAHFNTILARLPCHAAISGGSA